MSSGHHKEALWQECRKGRETAEEARGQGQKQILEGCGNLVNTLNFMVREIGSMEGIKKRSERI
jgi:hypothetical protein